MVFCGFPNIGPYDLWYTGIVEPANFSDDFTKSGVRVYNASDDVARGMEEIIPEIEARLDNLIGEGKLVASMKDQI